MDAFSKRLKELRADKGLTQLQLAQNVELSRSAIKQWENNLREPQISSVIRLAGYFHVTTDFLLGEQRSDEDFAKETTEHNFMELFSKRLKSLRLKNNLSQKKLSAATGISQSTIAQWEKELEEPLANAVIILSRFFEVSIDYLLGEDS